MRAKTVNEYHQFIRGREPMETLNLGKSGLKPFMINKAIDALPKNTYKALLKGFGTKEIYYFGDDDYFSEYFPGFYDYLAKLTSGLSSFREKAKYRYDTGRERMEQTDIIEIFDTEIGKIAKVYDSEIASAGGGILYAGDFKAALGVNLRDKKKLLDP